MARYTINYLTGDTETITADKVNIDDESQVFVFHTGRFQNEPDAIVLKDNVRSVHRQDDNSSAPIAYPYQEGDVTVLGPEVFASADGEAISWRGENYTRNPRNLLGKVTG